MKIEFRKLQNLFFLIFCVVLMTNCGTEDAINQQQINETTKINEAKIWFIKYQSENKFYYKFENQSYDWDNASVEILENESSAIVVPVVDKNKMENYRGNKVLYLYPLEDKKNFETTLYELLPTSESLSEQNSTKDLTNFDGYIIAWNLERGFIESTKFEKSASIATVSREEIQSKKVIDNSSKMVPDPPAASYCLGDVILCNDYKNNGGGYDGNGYVYYVNSGVGYSSGGYAGSYFNSSHGSGGGGSGITAPTPAQIIDALTGKAKCLNALLNKNGDSFVQKLLANFAGKSEFDIKIVSVDKIIVKDKNGNLIELNGETRYNKDINSKLINIAISTSRANDNSSLDVARTILHEYIHADIIRKIYTKYNIPGELDFKLVYEKYGSQHGTMAALYLSSMKEALKEFNKTVLPNDYKNYTDYYGEEPSDAFYEALAWSGLKENNVQAWTNLTAQQQQEINNLAARVTKMSKTVNCPQ